MKNLFIPLCLLASFPVFSQNSDSAQYYYNIGMQEQTAKRYMVASKAFDKAIAFNPKHIDAYLQNGYANLEMRKTDNAKSYFAKVNELEPGNAAAIKELAQLYFGYHQYQLAKDMAQKCATCPGNEKIIAMSNYHLEDFAGAVKGLLSFLKKNPNDAEANYTIASSYLAIEENAKAAQYYEKAIQLDDTKAGWMNELGIVYYQTDNFKNAAIAFSKAAEHGFPVTASFSENLGYSYIYSGAYDKGEKILLDLWAKKPGNKDILRDIADVYYQGKMYDKSLEFCQKILEKDMNDAKALYQAGLCFQKKGDKSRGQQMCDKAIEMDPSLTSMRKQQMLNPGL